MRKWLRLLRAHTAPLETIYGALGGLLASGNPFATGFFGFLYHITGYGMNSLTDWLSGYDREDPYKQHHPLNTGEITPKQAKILIASLFAFSLLYALYLSRLKLEPIIVLMTMIICGSLYNLMGKKTSLKFIPISISNTSVFVFTFLSIKQFDPLAVYVTAYIFLQIVHQIAVSGELKEIETKEVNLLKTLGVKVENGYLKFTRSAQAFSIIVKALGLLTLYFFANPFVILLIPFIIWFTIEEIRSRRWERDKLLRIMSIKEVLSTFALVIALGHIIGWAWSIGLILFAITYYIALNKYQWGTYLFPRV